MTERIDQYRKRRIRLYAVIGILIACSVSGYAMGMFTAQGDKNMYVLDMTRTAICCQSTTEALIQGTNARATQYMLETQRANIQITQTAIADIKATITQQLELTPTPK